MKKKVLQNLEFSKTNFLKKFCKISNSLKLLAKTFREFKIFEYKKKYYILNMKNLKTGI